MRYTTSASNIFRRKLCPGSERMEAKYGDSQSNEAREGTLLHNYDAEKTLIPDGLPPDVRWIYDRGKRLEEETVKKALAKMGVDGSGKEHREITLTLRRGMKVELVGHADLVKLYGEYGIVIDKKYGFLEVTPAEINMQLRAYAVMARKKWPRLQLMIVAIIQPRLSNAEAVTMALYDPDDLDAAEQEIYAVLGAARTYDAPLSASFEGCRYCRAKATCDVYRAAWRLDAPQAIAELTNDQLGQILEALDLAEMIKEDARDEARKRLLAAPFSVASYKLGKPRKTPVVRDKIAFAGTLLRKFGFSETEMADVSTFSVKRAREVLESKYPNDKKLDVEARLNEECAGMIEYTESDPPLLRKSEKERREEIEYAARNMAGMVKQEKTVTSRRIGPPAEIESKGNDNSLSFLSECK